MKSLLYTGILLVSLIFISADSPFSLGIITSSRIKSTGCSLKISNASSPSVDGTEVKLTATEYKIVELLMEHPGQVFSAEKIYEKVWKEAASYTVENTVMVHIRHIREKIEIDTKNPKYVKVVWGIGYKMEKY